MAGSLVDLCDLVAARLVAGSLGTDVVVSAFGDPDCNEVAVLVRPLLGEGPPVSFGGANRQCQREVQLVVGVYAMMTCGSETCHRRVAELTSGCSEAGSILAALRTQVSLTAFQAAGYTVRVDQPRGYTYAAYKSRENNAYWAQVPIAVLYCCE